jgi:hypothetical protein
VSSAGNILEAWHSNPVYCPEQEMMTLMEPSKLLLKMKMKRRQSRIALDPAQKMLAAFSISIEARKLLIAGLRRQGFSEAEILKILKERRK